MAKVTTDQPPKKKINLALQGGGAHGAFTWGVLDALLADGRIEIEAISGTSAGAMNAAVTAAGLTRGGADGARANLNQFWQQVAAVGQLCWLHPTWLDKVQSIGNLDFSPQYLFYDYISKVLSPYAMNPLNLNPLKDVLTNLINFEQLREKPACKLFIAATNVMNGKLRVFANQDISVEAILASACLPFIFQAVMVENEYYWDGGFIGNPPLFPLILETTSPDILIIQINPLNIDEVPTTAREILDRMNTLSFNSSLVRELRAVKFVTQLIDEGQLSTHKHKRVFIHTIEAEPVVKDLSVSSKFNPDWQFLHYLFEQGQALAKQFLDKHFADLNLASSTDLSKYL